MCGSMPAGGSAAGPGSLAPDTARAPAGAPWLCEAEARGLTRVGAAGRGRACRKLSIAQRKEGANSGAVEAEGPVPQEPSGAVGAAAPVAAPPGHAGEDGLPAAKETTASPAAVPPSSPARPAA